MAPAFKAIADKYFRDEKAFDDAMRNDQKLVNAMAKLADNQSSDPDNGWEEFITWALDNGTMTRKPRKAFSKDYRQVILGRWRKIQQQYFNPANFRSLKTDPFKARLPQARRANDGKGRR